MTRIGRVTTTRIQAGTLEGIWIVGASTGRAANAGSAESGADTSRDYFALRLVICALFVSAAGGRRATREFPNST